MYFFELVKEARSCRRFDEAKPLSLQDVLWLVECARFAPCGRNAQELRYIAVVEKSLCDLLTQNCSWAGALKNWTGPGQGERPTAYLAVLMPERGGEIPCFDTGIACQTIQLAATSRGWGACMLYSFKRETVKTALDAPAGLNTALLVALGVPAEKRVVDAMPADGSFNYWRDAQGVHHVPKRTVAEMVIKKFV